MKAQNQDCHFDKSTQEIEVSETGNPELGKRRNLRESINEIIQQDNDHQPNKRIRIEYQDH